MCFSLEIVSFIIICFSFFFTISSCLTDLPPPRWVISSCLRFAQREMGLSLLCVSRCFNLEKNLYIIKVSDFITAWIFCMKLTYYSFLIAVFILWLKSVKESLLEIRELSGGLFLGEHSTLRVKLTQIIWDNAESPVKPGLCGFAIQIKKLISVYLYCSYQYQISPC